MSCNYCNKDFVPRNRRQRYCSKSCGVKSHPPNKEKKERIKIICEFCSKEFQVICTNPRRFCSHKCYGNSLVGKIPWNKGRGNYSWYVRAKKSKRWKEWRESVFKRDDYTCRGKYIIIERKTQTQTSEENS